MRELHDIEFGSSTSGVSLLVSILIRYPEISTVTYDPEIHSLKFCFMISSAFGREEFDSFKDDFLLNLMVYWDVIRVDETKTIDISCDNLDKMMRIEVCRDLSTLTAEEISLMVGIVTQRFGDNLVKDRCEDLPEEYVFVHEEMIRNLLADVTDASQEKKLIGFREEGRVMVFNRTAEAN